TVSLAGAVLTGFEPATSGLTGRRALQTAPQDQGCKNPGGTLIPVIPPVRNVRPRAEQQIAQGAVAPRTSLALPTVEASTEPPGSRPARGQQGERTEDEKDTHSAYPRRRSDGRLAGSIRRRRPAGARPRPRGLRR